MDRRRKDWGHLTSTCGDPGISVIVPTWQAGQQLPQLLFRLQNQSTPPTETIVVDSSSTDGTRDLAAERGCGVEVIPKADFSHGGTPNLCAELAQGHVLVFMTQDALPVDRSFLGELARPIPQGCEAAACARQVPRSDAPPPESHIRAISDVPRMGFKAFFFSNVASAVSREALCAVGGFPERVIMDEDVLLCARPLCAGYRAAPQAEAAVYHSHHYTLSQQFKRYFDIGTFISQAGEALEGAKTGEEGVSL